MPLASPRKTESAVRPPRGVLLGEGGMSRVWEAGLPGPSRVLKIARESRYNETLLREARLGAEIRHPALLPVLDYGLDEEGLAWLLLPRRSAALPELRDPRLLAQALGEVADALDLLHHHGWVHADLKPGNLLTGGDGSLQLADLGMAARRGERREGGSLAYLSPGRLAGEGVHPRDDVHALAVLAYELLAGRLPHAAEGGEQLLRAIRSGDTIPLGRSRPDLPEGLERVFAEFFAGDDPGSAMAFMDRLGAAAGLPGRPRALFYRAAPLPAALAEKARHWLEKPSARGSRLGRVLLLAGAGRAEAGLLRESLSGLPWMEETEARGDLWIVRMEQSLAEGERPRAAVFGEQELDEEAASYLRSRGETLELPGPRWSAAQLRSWLKASLSSTGHEALAPGGRELGLLAEAAAEGLDALEELLRFLLDRQLLRDENGVAALQADPSAWRGDWESRSRRDTASLPVLARRVLGVFAGLELPLSESELSELTREEGPPLRMALDELLASGWLIRRAGRLRLAPGRRPPEGVEALPGLSMAWLARAWDRAGSRPSSRLALLRYAFREGCLDWLGALPASEILPLAQGLPLDRVASFARERRRPPGALGLFGLMASLRRGRLPEVLLDFWDLEPRLDLETSAELCRRLSNTLLRDKSVEEGFAFLDRWRRQREEDIAGSELEIRVAAREVVSYAHHGLVPDAEKLLASYRLRFAGRKGGWFLDWAESLVHSERQDYESAARVMERALRSAEDLAGATDRFSLAVHLAELLLVQSRLDEGETYLRLALRGAEETGRPEHLRYVHNSLGLYELECERFADAEKQFRRSLRIAREEGAWREPSAARNNLALSLYQQGEYGRMEPVVEEIERACAGSARLADLLSERNLLARVHTGCGRLDKAARHLELSLPVARETGARRMEARLLRKRGGLRRLKGEIAGALDDCRRARACFEELGLAEEVLLCQLGELEADPSGDVAFLDELLERFIGQGQRMARVPALRQRARARRIGDPHGAAADLSEAEAEVARLGNPELLWPLRAEAAELALSRGDAAGARRLLDQALALLRELAGRFAGNDAGARYLARSDRRAVLDRRATLEGDTPGPSPIL